MLKNYFRIAFAVFKRRKFFTIISLFGISITLAILMVLTALKDSVIAGNYPETKRDNCLYVIRVTQTNSTEGSSRRSEPSFNFLEKYVTILHTPAAVAITSIGTNDANVYRNNKKLDFNIAYTNAAYWNVLEFKFLQGRPFSAREIKSGEYVTVISEKAKEQYFGDSPDVIGKFINANNANFRVLGVVKTVPASMAYSSADLYMPYTISKSNYKNKAYQGNFIAILLAKSKKELPAIEAELQTVVAKIPPEEKYFDRISVHADPFTESFTRMIFGDNNSSGVGYFYLIIAVFVFLFMLLPTINLVNINISRIMERSSEIAVRKAFGASSSRLLVQFIYENILFTLVGGIIGTIIASAVIYLINDSNVFGNMDLQVNLRVLSISILLCLLFGFFSGVLPAWKMSQMNVSKALKQAP